MSVLWHHGVGKGRITPSEFVAITSTNTAKIFNIFPRKGAVAVGSDADLVIWDPAKTRTISAKTHHQNVDTNIYEGMSVTGNAAITLSRGRVLWENDQLRTERGTGKYIDRPCFPDYWTAQGLRNAVAEPKPVRREVPAP